MSETDFEVEMFNLFNINALRECLHDENKRDSIVQFARLVAGYYLNYTPPLCSTQDRSPLPNLLLWSELSVNIDDSIIDELPCWRSRQALATAIPPALTPCVVAQLLVYYDHWLEAVFFVDNFNDFRTQILLRRIIDNKFCLNLFEEHCESHLSQLLLNQISNDAVNLVDSDEIIQIMRRHVDIIVQIDVVFETELLVNLKRNVLNHIHNELASLQDDDVDIRVQLPRPPIYAATSKIAADDIIEICVWNRIYYLIQLLLICLSRTNSLEVLVSMVVTWLINARQAQDKEETDIPYMIEGELARDEIPYEDVLVFEQLIFCILQMELRDRISFFWRQSNLTNASQIVDLLDEEGRNELIVLERKYTGLFGEYNNVNASEKIDCLAHNLRKWMHTTMDAEDVQFLMNFLNFTHSAYPQREKYFGILNKETASKWRATILSQISIQKHENKSLDEILIIKESDKIQVSSQEMLRLRFLEKKLPGISLCAIDNRSLINISLRINISAFVCCIDTCNFTDPKIDEEYEESLESVGKEFVNQIKSNEIANNEEVLSTDEILLKNIRASITRLSEMQKTTNIENNREAYNENPPNINSSYLYEIRLDSLLANDNFESLNKNFQMERLQEEISAHRVLLQKFMKKTEFNSYNKNSLTHRDRKTMKTKTSSRSLPTNFSSKIKYNQEKEVQIKLSSLPKTHILNMNIDSASKEETVHYTNRSNQSSISSLTQNSRVSSGRFSDISSKTLSSRQLREEIDEIEQRLSRLRDDLRAQAKFNSSERKITKIESSQNSKVESVHKNNDRDSEGYLSDDSVLRINTPPSKIGVMPMDFSALNSSGDEVPAHKNLVNRKWSELEIYPRPSKQQHSQNKNRTKYDKILTKINDKNYMEDSKLKNDELPPWLQLLPSKDEVKFKENDYSNRIYNQFNYSYPLLQLPQCTDMTNDKKNEKKRLQDKVSQTINRLDEKKNFLFASDLTREEADDLIQHISNK